MCVCSACARSKIGNYIFEGQVDAWILTLMALQLTMSNSKKLLVSSKLLADALVAMPSLLVAMHFEVASCY